MTDAEINLLQVDHKWLINPLEKAVNHLAVLPFFDWLKNLKTVQDFRPVGTQIFHHSVTLPKAIGLILSATPPEKGILYQIYAKHAFDEADHHLLLLSWLLKHGLIQHASEVYIGHPTIETSNCINLGYELAVSRDHNGWLAAMNGAIELCFYRFFLVASQKMISLGTGDHYFDVHVGADAEHSIMGLRYITDLDTKEKRRLVRKALDAVTLWTLMVNSWIGVSMRVAFDDAGEYLS